MEIKLEGGNSVVISTKQWQVLVDPAGQDPKVATNKKTSVVLLTQERLGEGVKTGEAFVISEAGEYEVGGVSIKGIVAASHIDAGLESTVFKLSTTTVNILITGHIEGKLSEEQLESIGTIDIMIVPVGGGGYTLDSTGAAGLVRKVEPKVVIPTHYKMSGVEYEVPQAEVDLFLKELGASEVETQDKFTVSAELPEKMQVIRLK